VFIFVSSQFHFASTSTINHQPSRFLFHRNNVFVFHALLSTSLSLFRASKTSFMNFVSLSFVSLVCRNSSLSFLHYILGGRLELENGNQTNQLSLLWINFFFSHFSTSWLPSSWPNFSTSSLASRARSAHFRRSYFLESETPWRGRGAKCQVEMECEVCINHFASSFSLATRWMKVFPPHLGVSQSRVVATISKVSSLRFFFCVKNRWFEVNILSA